MKTGKTSLGLRWTPTVLTKRLFISKSPIHARQRTISNPEFLFFEPETWNAANVPQEESLKKFFIRSPLNEPAEIYLSDLPTVFPADVPAKQAVQDDILSVLQQHGKAEKSTGSLTDQQEVLNRLFHENLDSKDLEQAKENDSNRFQGPAHSDHPPFSDQNNRNNKNYENKGNDQTNRKNRNERNSLEVSLLLKSSSPMVVRRKRKLHSLNPARFHRQVARLHKGNQLTGSKKQLKQLDRSISLKPASYTSTTFTPCRSASRTSCTSCIPHSSSLLGFIRKEKGVFILALKAPEQKIHDSWDSMEWDFMEPLLLQANQTARKVNNHRILQDILNTRDSAVHDLPEGREQAKETKWIRNKDPKEGPSPTENPTRRILVHGDSIQISKNSILNDPFDLPSAKAGRDENTQKKKQPTELMEEAETDRSDCKEHKRTEATEIERRKRKGDFMHEK